MWCLTHFRRRALSAAALLTLVVGGTLGLTECSSPTSATSDTSAPAGDFARIFPVDGHRVYFQCVGSGSPTIVLISGAGVSSDSWDYVGDTADTAHPPHKSP